MRNKKQRSKLICDPCAATTGRSKKATHREAGTIIGFCKDCAAHYREDINLIRIPSAKGAK